jgi:hypothetical protein
MRIPIGVFVVPLAEPAKETLIFNKLAFPVALPGTFKNL